MVEVNVAEKSNFIEVAVSDQGVGMTRENAEKIFRIDVKYKSPGNMVYPLRRKPALLPCPGKLIINFTIIILTDCQLRESFRVL